MEFSLQKPQFSEPGIVFSNVSLGFELGQALFFRRHRAAGRCLEHVHCSAFSRKG